METKRIKKSAVLIKAEKRILELEQKLKTVEDSKDMYYKRYMEHDDTLNGLHSVLDDLGIKGFKDENKYNRIPLAVRLFAWALNATGKNINKGE